MTSATCARTRSLVLAYLERPGRRGEEELWVVFERGRRPGRAARRSPGLNAPHLGALLPDEEFGLWRCRQQPLITREKEAMILSLDRRQPRRSDPRLRQRGIADVGDGRRADEEAIDRRPGGNPGQNRL